MSEREREREEEGEGEREREREREREISCFLNLLKNFNLISLSYRFTDF